MTKQDRDKLRALAMAATPGEWAVNGGDDLDMGDDRVYIGDVENAAYIAAANPATLLALLDRIDELERADAEYAERGTINVDDLIIQRDYWEKIATALAERVGEHFGFEVGEHSNMNCPVLNALESKWTDPPTERAVPEWQPIETAPRDNPRCLTYTPDRLCESDAISICPQNLLYTHSEATHWMPLPAAPGAGGAE